MKTVGKLTANVGWEMNEVNFVEVTGQRYSYFFKCKAGMQVRWAFQRAEGLPNNFLHRLFVIL
ncbi:hypothetical protein A3860_35150 [Niastella vici]|uniref:Uncharacterized protein n=1 Tax=Niastella vici TaxID=1703345 RepID=A0A1V9FP13_9BACT|nr:hypothetical protein A3860_35150 [Niastella vici]